MMPSSAPQEHPSGEEASLPVFYYSNIFCSKLREKASRYTHAKGRSFPLILPSKMFILVATF